MNTFSQCALYHLRNRTSWIHFAIFWQLPMAQSGSICIYEHYCCLFFFFVIVHWFCYSWMRSQWSRVWTATMVLVWVHLVVNMPVCWDLEDTVDLTSQLFQSLHNLNQILHSLTSLHHHHRHYHCHWEVTMTPLHYVNQEEMTVQIGKLYPGECGTYIMIERHLVGTMMSL